MAIFSRGPHEYWLKPHFSKNEVAKSGVNYRELVKKIPLDRLLVETDTVAGARVPTRPHIRDVLAKTAEILNLSASELERITDENADRFFGVV